MINAIYYYRIDVSKDVDINHKSDEKPYYFPLLVVIKPYYFPLLVIFRERI